MGRLIAKILAWLAILLGLALLIQPTAAQWWTSTRNAINAVFASPRFFTTEQWVDFKLWGYIFPILFVIGQGLYIARHWKDKETE